MSSHQDYEPTWKDLILPVYLPSFLLAFGSGLLIPTLPLYAQSFDLSFSMVSLVVAASSIGTVIGDVPAGMLLERVSRKTGMVIGISIVLVGMTGLGLARTSLELILYQGLSGLGMALWQTSRHTFITDVIAVRSRGRALAIFGGVGRTGAFTSPAIGGMLGAAFGLRMPIFVYAAVIGIVLVLVIWFIVDTRPEKSGAGPHEPWRQVRDMAVRHARPLLTAGSAQIFAQMIRQGRRLIIPLYGVSVIGLDVEAVGLIMTLSSAVDMLLFPAAGYIMDHYGRKYSAVPAFLIMGAGMALIPLTSSFTGLLLATLVIGLGNGLGSGTMMTLGADLAPPHSIGQFLGLWRFIGDVGGVGGPLVVGNFADAFGLSVAAFSLSGIGAVASVILVFLVRETLKKPQHPPPQIKGDPIGDDSDGQSPT